MSETRKKALTYLRDGKVTVHSASRSNERGRRVPCIVSADVIGQHSTYMVGLPYGKQEWTCTCHNDDCAHVAAVQLVTGHPSKAAK